VIVNNENEGASGRWQMFGTGMDQITNRLQSKMLAFLKNCSVQGLGGSCLSV
jgi:hypothetical protein